MAKKNEQQTTSGNIDIAKFLPKGFSLDDFEKVGGLRPICTPDLNAEAPIVGHLVALLDMPPRDDGSAWQAVLLRTLSPGAKAKAGDEVVSLGADEDVLIPVGGNLKNNSDMLAAAVDPDKVVPAIFYVDGQVDTGKPSKMWSYDVRLAFKKAIPRTGAYALYHRPQTPAAALAQGTVTDRNGQPVARLVG